MRYTEAVEYMESLSHCDNVPDWDSLKRVCERLGNPEKSFSLICIEGTGGRESVPAYVSTVLKCAGYKVGRYISYVGIEYRDRFQVGNRPISQKAFAELVEKIQEVSVEITADGYSKPTVVEAEIALAFQYFENQGCELVLLETDDLQGISDISKKTKAVVVPHMDRAAAKKVKYGLEKQKFDYRERTGLEISLAGVCQIHNAVLAVEVSDSLQKHGLAISETALRKGLQKTQCPGCFSVIGKRPYFIADCACNVDSVIELAESIEQYFTNKRIIFIMGLSQDAECEKIINRMHSYADWIITVAIPNDKQAISSYELAAEVAKVHPNVTAVDSPEEAVEIGYLLARKEDVIIAFGSPNIFQKFFGIMSTQAGKKSGDYAAYEKKRQVSKRGG